VGTLFIVVAVVLAALGISGGSQLTFGGGSMGDSAGAATMIAGARSRKGWLYSLGAGGGAGSKPSPPYTDCGLLIKDAHADAGVTMPRNITGQVNAAPYKQNVQGWSRERLLAALQAGDCVAFDWAGGFAGREYDHGGIWTGDSLLHASSSAGKVVEVPMIGSGWKTIYSWWR
jgi:cell wall-associated NlpC family hydrolase